MPDSRSKALQIAKTFSICPFSCWPLVLISLPQACVLNRTFCFFVESHSYIWYSCSPSNSRVELTVFLPATSLFQVELTVSILDNACIAADLSLRSNAVDDLQLNSGLGKFPACAYATYSLVIKPLILQVVIFTITNYPNNFYKPFLNRRVFITATRATTVKSMRRNKKTGLSGYIKSEFEWDVMQKSI